MGVAAIVVVWLAFSILKKVIGFAVLIAFLIAGYMLWTNPVLLRQVLAFLPG